MSVHHQLSLLKVGVLNKHICCSLNQKRRKTMFKISDFGRCKNNYWDSVFEISNEKEKMWLHTKCLCIQQKIESFQIFEITVELKFLCGIPLEYITINLLTKIFLDIELLIIDK